MATVAAQIKCAFALYATEPLSKLIAENYEVARKEFIPEITRHLHACCGKETTVSSCNVHGALDSSHFDGAGWRNQFVGRFSSAILLRDQERFLRVRDRYGLFCVRPRGATDQVYVWAPTFWDRHGRRACASLAADRATLRQVMGETVESRLLGEIVPRYTPETFATLKRTIRHELIALLPPLDRALSVASSRCCRMRSNQVNPLLD